MLEAYNCNGSNNIARYSTHTVYMCVLQNNQEQNQTDKLKALKYSHGVSK